MKCNAVLGRVLALAVLSSSALAWFPQAASATPSLSLTTSADPDSSNTDNFVVSGSADEASYLYVFQQASTSTCAATAAAEQSSVSNQDFVGGYDVSAGAFSENGTFGGGPGSYLLCGYLTAANAAAASDPPSASATTQPVVIDACPPPVNFTMTHISITTVKNGPEFDGGGTLTVQANTAGGDLTATGYDQSNDGGGSDSSSYTVRFYDSGPGAPQRGDRRSYQITLTPQDPGQCYDSGTGTVVQGSTQSVTHTLVVTYFSVGQGGEGSVNGSTIPGSDAETPVPGAPVVAVTGGSRVAATATCSAAVPKRDFAGAYTWYVAGTEVATGSSYKIPASAYQKHLACSARAYNNAGKPSPVGVSRPVAVSVGPPLRSIGTPGLDGQTRVGTSIRVTHGEWSPKATSYSYQWYSGSHKIRHATQNKYRIAKKYKGKKITCRVTASARGYADGTAAAKPIKVA